MSKPNLPWQPAALVIVLCVFWGANMGMVKIAAPEVASIFQAAIRSFGGALFLMAWMLIKGIPFFPSRQAVGYGWILAFIFAAQFAVIYYAVGFHLASRVYVLVHTAPFFVALGAHFFLQDDRLNTWKVAGLILAFIGVLILFVPQFAATGQAMIWGDLLSLIGGALWGATTIFVKRFAIGVSAPSQVLLQQTLFSTPLLVGISLWLEPEPIKGFSWVSAGVLFYQSFVIVFISYLLWFMMVKKHPVSLLHAFSFLTPVFGVFISGMLMLGEPVTWRLVSALALVSLGLVLVNHHPKETPV
ncbi:MAG: DMT family transporter [Desulfarculaceae bacterium]